MILYSGQRLSQPFVQYSHIPQLMPGAIRAFSPAEWLRTSFPTSAISPATSLPEMWGMGTRSFLVPVRAQMSKWFRAQALTLTRTSVSPYGGLGVSSYRSFSVPPFSWNLTAFKIGSAEV